MTKHYLQYLTEVMEHQWNDLALSDYNENHEYTFGELAVEILRLHVLFEQLGLKRGDKIALCGRNCANWAVERGHRATMSAAASRTMFFVSVSPLVSLMASPKHPQSLTGLAM